MNKIWFISDPHFNHHSCVYPRGDRPAFRQGFSSMDQHNDLMIKNYNQKVGLYDIVWFMGDVFFGREADGLKIVDMLPGKKNLILGNHDKLTPAFCNRFKKIELWRKYKREGIVISHMPLHKDVLAEIGDGEVTNFHGHIHNKPSPKKDGRFQWINICVEKTNYMPLEWNDLVKAAKRGML